MLQGHEGSVPVGNVATTPAAAVEVGWCRPEQLDDWLRAVEVPFGHTSDDNEVEDLKKIIDVQRCICAMDDGTIVGTAAAFSYGLSVPGGVLPAAGVTMVGVQPTHRRRGILTRMMRAQFDELRERAEPLAILWASEAPIYRRYGYGLASLQGAINIERERTAFRSDPEPAGRLRLVDIDEAARLLPSVYEGVRCSIPGMFTRTPEWWRHHRLRDDPARRNGAGPLFVAVLETGVEVVGYALYRLKPSWAEGSPGGTLEVLEAMATNDPATAQIWRFLFDIDLVARIEAWWLPADHPLMLLVREPRRLRLRLQDALWLRVVDLRAALEGRSYSGEDTLVLEVQDTMFPDNAGRWRLEASPEGAVVSRTEADADLALDIQDLASPYLGGITWRALRGAGRVSELRHGAARRADALFVSDRSPWCPEIF